MSTISKLRYRPAAIQPSSTGKGEAHHSVKRRIAAVEEAENLVDEDQYMHEIEEKEELEKLDLEAGASSQNVDFNPESSQWRTQEAFILSDEAKYRSENYPTIQDKMELHRQHLQQKHKEELMKQALAEKLRKMEEKRIMDEERRKEAAKKRKGLLAKVRGAGAEDGFAVDDEEEEAPDGQDDMGMQDNEEYRLAMLVSKERRLTNQRLTARVHEPLSGFSILMTQLALSLQLASTSALVTRVLPWLYVGRGNVAQNIHSLSKLSATHILNVTKEVPNYFPATFVYQRIPIKDDVKEDASKYFLTAINFLNRVEACKGIVYVHCTVGASRAPTMILSWLVAAKNVPLQDALRFLQRKRPAVSPNSHFMCQLAALEVKVTKGKSSVLYDPSFNLFEFNETKKGSNMELRPVKKLWKATRDILRNDFEPVEVQLEAAKGWG